MLKFVKTQKGKDQLAHDGFLYNSNGENKTTNTRRWRCKEYQSSKCPGKICTCLDNVNIVEGSFKPHSHIRDASEINVARMKKELIQAAETTSEATSQIINNVLQVIEPLLRTLKIGI